MPDSPLALLVGGYVLEANKNSFYTVLCAGFRDTPTRVVIGLQYAGIDRGIYRL